MKKINTIIHFLFQQQLHSAVVDVTKIKDHEREKTNL